MWYDKIEAYKSRFDNSIHETIGSAKKRDISVASTRIRDYSSLDLNRAVATPSSIANKEIVSCILFLADTIRENLEEEKKNDPA